MDKRSTAAQPDDLSTLPVITPKKVRHCQALYFSFHLLRFQQEAFCTGSICRVMPPTSSIPE